jgi:hypothetical protein
MFNYKLYATRLREGLNSIVPVVYGLTFFQLQENMSLVCSIEMSALIQVQGNEKREKDSDPARGGPGGFLRRKESFLCLSMCGLRYFASFFQKSVDICSFLDPIFGAYV